MKVHFFLRPQAKKATVNHQKGQEVWLGGIKKSSGFPYRTVHGEKKGEKRDFFGTGLSRGFPAIPVRPTSLNAFLSCRMFQDYCWIKRRCFVQSILGWIRLYNSCFCVPFPPPFFPWHSLRLLFKRGASSPPLFCPFLGFLLYAKWEFSPVFMQRLAATTATAAAAIARI